MKLLLFSDLHADLAAARRVVGLSRTADVVVGAGDFCNAHRGLDACVRVLKAIDKPTVLVAGNNETTDELAAACRDWPAARVLHGAGAVVGGVTFFGLGGGVPVTPFGAWSYDFTEEEAAAAQRPDGCEVRVAHLHQTRPAEPCQQVSAMHGVGPGQHLTAQGLAGLGCQTRVRGPMTAAA